MDELLITRVRGGEEPFGGEHIFLLDEIYTELGKPCRPCGFEGFPYWEHPRYWIDASRILARLLL